MKPMVVPARVSRDSWSPQARLQLVASVLVMSGQSYGIGFFPETERERERAKGETIPPRLPSAFYPFLPSVLRRKEEVYIRGGGGGAEGKKCNIGDSGETSGGGGRVIPPFPVRGSYTYLQCTVPAVQHYTTHYTHVATTLQCSARQREIEGLGLLLPSLPALPFPPEGKWGERRGKRDGNKISRYFYSEEKKEKACHVYG